MSPYLFVIAMEYLNRILNTLQHTKFQLHPRCKKLKIMQLSFANDLLMFSKGDAQSVQRLFQCFTWYSNAFGLQANIQKCSIYFGGVSERVQEQILDLTGMAKGELPIRYLGVPLSTKRLFIVQCQPLLEKMLGRITSWTTKFLTYEGRLQPSKAVLFSNQTYWTLLFLLPRKILKTLSKFVELSYGQEELNCPIKHWLCGRNFACHRLHKALIFWTSKSGMRHPCVSYYGI